MVKVSVVIPYYNSKKTILRALHSVVNQTYRDFEIILINDGSTDNSEQVVNEFTIKNKNIKMININQTNLGPSKARNTGIKIAKGEYVAFLDSDDSWNKNKLEIQMKFIKKNKYVSILGCDYNVIKNNDIVINKSNSTGKYIKVDFYKRLFKNYFSTPTVIVKKKVIAEFNGFNENQKYAEDSLLFLKILREYDGGKIELPLVNLYKNEYGDSGLSTNLKILEKWELNNFKVLYRENNKYNKKINFLLYLCIIIFSYLKYLRRLLIVKLRRKSD